MKKLALLALTVLGMTSCWTSIWTVAPTDEPVAPVRTVYTTTVTTPSPKTTTVTTVTVTNYNADMCFYLDLNAVAAAFAEADNVREFEQLLNSSRYMINNLDLNRDGWVDYLRVIETRNGYYHALLIQACLAPGVFQDVATLVAERMADRLYVEVIGDPYLYGYNYIVRPVFVKRPPMWNTYGRSSYTVWSSPYYWDYYPSYYTKPKPIYLNHYQAYVSTYMSNHHYCHHCDYPTTPHYSSYTTMTQPHHRNDYQTSHPEQSFENRVTRTISASSTGGVSVRNAGQLRTEVNKEAAKSQESKVESQETKTTGTSVRTTETKPTTTGTSVRTTDTKASTTSRTSQESKTSTTTTKTTGTSVRTTDTKTNTTKTTSTSVRQPSTTVETRVKSSGTTRTTIKTTDNTGRTTSVKRESTNTSTRSTNNSTKTSGSVRSSQGPSRESSPRSSQPSR